MACSVRECQNAAAVRPEPVHCAPYALVACAIRQYRYTLTVPPAIAPTVLVARATRPFHYTVPVRTYVSVGLRPCTCSVPSSTLLYAGRVASRELPRHRRGPVTERHRRALPRAPRRSRPRALYSGTGESVDEVAGASVRHRIGYCTANWRAAFIASGLSRTGASHARNPRSRSNPSLYLLTRYQAPSAASPQNGGRYHISKLPFL